MRWDGEKLFVYPKTGFHLTHQVKDKLITYDQNGINILGVDSLRYIGNASHSAYGIYELSKDKYVLMSASEGLFQMNINKKGLIDTIFSRVDVVVNEELKSARIYDYTPLKRGGFAVATLRNGFYVFNDKLECINHINSEKGLPEAMILGIREDSDNNIWLMLSGGIVKMEYNSSYSRLKINKDVKDIVNYKGHVFIATNLGLYYFDPNLDYISEEDLVLV